MNKEGKTEVKKIEQFVSLKGKKVLEIGCGNGRVSIFLNKRAKKLISIDCNPESIKKAKEKSWKIDFRVGSGENLEFKENSFDVIVFIFSLHHHNDPGKAISEAFKVLNEKGKVVIIEPTTHSEFYSLMHLFKEESQDYLKAICAIKSSGFCIEKEVNFFIDWEYKNKEEFFNGFRLNNRKEQKKAIIRATKLLGQKIYSCPLILREEPAMFILSK